MAFNFKNGWFMCGILMLMGYSGTAAADPPQVSPLLSPAPPPDDNKGVTSGIVTGRGWAGPAKIVDMNEAGLAKYKDEPLATPPSGPQSARFIVEHRSALNGQHVTLHGVVVSFIKGGCPTNPAIKMACMLPRLTIADAAGDDRQQKYDVQVMLPMDNQTTYEQGQIVDITGTVAGDSQGVAMTKD